MACTGNRPPQPPTPPTPAPPEPQCAAGQTTCCWHMPPGNQWLYACPAPDVPGGVLNVGGGPAQCPEHRCDVPTPPPPTPSPGGPVPPKGQPQNPELLLRNEGNQFFRTNAGARVDPFMAVPCCMGWAEVSNQRWPLASEGFMDETHKSGANMWHFRLGPWTAQPGVGDEDEWDDIGGPYLPNSLEWNSAYWDHVRSLAWHAHSLGGWIEAVPIDTWYLKHCAWHDVVCAWPDDQITIGQTLTREQERLARKSVSELGCFGFVHWALGNEEDEAQGMNAAWLNDQARIIRDEEQKNGCAFVHLIGTGSTKDGVQADYSVTHSKSPVTGPCNGRLCVNNEHNPEDSPEQEAQSFSTARAAGQVWAAWRAGASDEKWEERLRLFASVVGGGSTPAGCFVPASEPASDWVDPPLTPQQRPAQMMAAINAAKAAVGNRCGATAACDHTPTPDNPCAPPVHLGCLETNGFIAAELRKQGYCATGPWTDATAILAPDGKIEEMHVCSTGDGCYTGSPYKFAWTYKGQLPTPGPMPPPASACTNPPAHPIDHFNVKEHIKGDNKTTVDSTPIIHDAAYCSSIGMQAVDCPVRQEGDPLRATCEAEVATPVWVTIPPGGSVSTDNPYQLWVPRGQSGTAKVCAQQSPGACGSVQVTP